jgi:plasmid stabilization system protein ParE
MSLAIQKAGLFKQDFANQFSWYVDEAGPDVARRFQVALDNSLKKIAQRPDLGSRRRFKNPQLQGLRSIPVERPFDKLLLFYRAKVDHIEAWRLMHGARDLPRRLVEPPE